MWENLFSALALVLVLEGVLPFISPSFWRDMMRQAQQLEDKHLRIMGAVLMIVGLLVLAVVR